MTMRNPMGRMGPVVCIAHDSMSRKIACDRSEGVRGAGEAEEARAARPERPEAVHERNTERSDPTHQRRHDDVARSCQEVRH